MWDLMAIFGGLNGLALIAWGLLRVTDEKRTPTFTVGTGRGVDFTTTAPPKPPAAAKNE